MEQMAEKEIYLVPTLCATWDLAEEQRPCIRPGSSRR